MYSSNYKKENRIRILGHHTSWHDNNFYFSSLVGHLVFVVVEYRLSFRSFVCLTMLFKWQSFFCGHWVIFYLITSASKQWWICVGPICSNGVFFPHGSHGNHPSERRPQTKQILGKTFSLKVFDKSRNSWTMIIPTEEIKCNSFRNSSSLLYNTHVHKH